MKIALIDLRRYGGGNRTWAIQVANALEINLINWYPPIGGVQPSKKTVLEKNKDNDKITSLNNLGFDFIIFTDLPAGIDQNILASEIGSKLKVPWSIMIHGGSYNRSDVDSIKAMFLNQYFCGTFLTITEEIGQKFLNKFNLNFTRILPFSYLPYKMDKLSTCKNGDWVFNTSITASSRGMIPLSLVARNNSVKISHEGIPAILPGVHSGGLLLSTLVTDYGFKTSIEGATKYYAGLWEVYSPNGGIVRYKGGFSGLSDKFFDEAGLHVTLATVRDRGRYLDYVTLEAINYGVLPAVSEFRMNTGDYPGISVIPKYFNSRKYDFNSLEKSVVGSMAFTYEEKKDRIVKLQEFVASKHDPKVYVEFIKKELGLI